MEPKHLTRNELYELAWSKPLSKLAAEFGISSATFTKHVDRLEVPRPPSGYWQQLARGLTPSRTELTAATEDTPLEVVIDPSPPVSTLSAPNPSTPTVRVAETLSKPHPIVTQIRQHLKNHYRDHGQKTIYGEGHAVVRVGPDSEMRALRILDALIKAISNRGHVVRLRPDTQASGRFVLEALVGQEQLPVRLIEPLRRSDHVPSNEEKRRIERKDYIFIPKYDYAPSGQLELETDRPWCADVRSKWADGKNGNLEELLGEVLVGLERVALARRAERERRERERELEIEAKQRAEVRRRNIAHQRALGEALVKAAHSWQDAELVRAFLDVLDQRVPKSERSNEFDAWFAWAGEFAVKLDPTVTPSSLVQALEPSDSGSNGRRQT